MKQPTEKLMKNLGHKNSLDNSNCVGFFKLKL